MPIGKNLAYSVMVVAVLFSLFPLAPAVPAGAAQAPEPGLPPELNGGDAGVQMLSGANPLGIQEEWRYHMLGKDLGTRGIFVLDIDNDGRNELVATENNNAWFVIRKNSLHQYEVIWTSGKYDNSLTRIYVHDVDGDGIAEIFVARSDNRIRVYRGTDFQEIGLFHAGMTINHMIIADSDGNGTFEILVSDGNRTAAFDANSYLSQWRLDSYGGEIAVGNVDADPDTEIVLSKGYVFNGVTLALEWYYPASAGFGVRVRVGDIDGDGIDEILGAAISKTITIYDAGLKSPMWEITTSVSIDALTLADINGDNRPEIIYGDGYSKYIHCIDGVSRLPVCQVSNPESGVTNITVVDFDLDGALDVVWGAGHTSGGPDYLYVADILTDSIKWRSQDLDGPISAVAFGDIDDDGDNEIVMATFSSDSNYKDSVINIFDANTHQLEDQITTRPGLIIGKPIQSLRIGDVDDDGEMEIVVAISASGGARILVFNGRTRLLEQQSAVIYGYGLATMEIGDIDGDGKLEIVAGQAPRSSSSVRLHVMVLDGATLEIKWNGYLKDKIFSRVQDIHLADVDSDGQVEILAALSGDAVFVMDGVSGAKKAILSAKAYAVTSADLNQDGIQSILVGTSEGKVEFYHGKTYRLEKSISLDTGAINCLSLFDFDLDNSPELLACQLNRLSVYKTNDQTLLWRSPDLGNNLALYNQAPLGPIDNDTEVEILLGAENDLYQFEGSFSPIGFSTITVSQANAEPGDRLTYTIRLKNTGNADLARVTTVNTLPPSLSFIEGSLSASSGSAVFSEGTVIWEGPLPARSFASVTYQADLRADAPRASVINTAVVSAGSISHAIFTATFMTPYFSYIPVVVKPSGAYFDNFSVTLLASTGITASEAEEAVSVGAAAVDEANLPYHRQESYPNTR